MTRSELIKRVKETAYLEGDFILRSGKRSKYYLDKYLFETCPDILKALGEEFAKHVGDATEHIYSDGDGNERALGYIIEANGHSGGGSPTLNVTLKPVYFIVAETADADGDETADGSQLNPDDEG